MNTWIKTLGFAAALATAGVASAQRYGGYDGRGDLDYVWARVVSVEPIVAAERGRRVCWEQPVTYYQPGRNYPTYRRDAGGALVGALIGGAIGNQIGSGDGRRAATVAGAIAGAAIASDNDRGYRDGRGYYSEPGYRRVGYEQVCERRRDGWRNRVLGYDVAYRLDGRIYHTRTDEHPGRRVRVAIADYDDRYDDRYDRRY